MTKKEEKEAKKLLKKENDKSYRAMLLANSYLIHILKIYKEFPQVAKKYMKT